MALSCFTPAGVFRCSSKKPVTRRLYEALVESYGPGFTGPYAETDIYGTAMCLGSSQLELERAIGQQIPSRCTEFLSGFEDQYGIVPAADASLQDRRRGLAAARMMRNGARVDAIQDGLREILGSGFIKYIVSSGVNPIPSTPTAPAAFKRPTTPITVIRLSAGVMPGSQSVAFTRITGESSPFSAGDVVVVAPNRNGMAERVTLTAATGDGDAGTITATFTKPHELGTFATTAPWPMWISYQRHVNVIVTAAVIADAALMRRVKEFMRKWSRVVTWSTVSPENSAGSGTSGPFYPGSGLPGVTPVGTVTW